MTTGWLAGAAKAWLWLVCGLAACSLLPVLWGWHPVVVLSGSMAPAVRPGDVVLVDRDVPSPAAGQLVLVRDPGVPSGRLLHRVTRVEADGTIVTRGDANPTDDPRPVRPTDVTGRARLVVPAAGRFVMLVNGPGRGDLAWAFVTLCALAVTCIRRADDEDASHRPKASQQPAASRRAKASPRAAASRRPATPRRRSAAHARPAASPFLGGRR